MKKQYQQVRKPLTFRTFALFDTFQIQMPGFLWLLTFHKIWLCILCTFLTFSSFRIFRLFGFSDLITISDFSEFQAFLWVRFLFIFLGGHFLTFCIFWLSDSDTRSFRVHFKSSTFEAGCKVICCFCLVNAPCYNLHQGSRQSVQPNQFGKGVSLQLYMCFLNATSSRPWTQLYVYHIRTWCTARQEYSYLSC